MYVSEDSYKKQYEQFQEWLSQCPLKMANYQQWSQSYFTGLTLTQHSLNNLWFEIMLEELTPNQTNVFDKILTMEGKS